MGVVDREQVKAVLVNVAPGLVELPGVGVITDDGLVVHILERVDAQRLVALAGDNPTGFLRRPGARLCDELGELLACKLHGNPHSRA